MKLELKKLVLLAQLNCYDSKYDLMESEIYEEDIEEYRSDKRNFKEKMEEWFFDSISGRTEEVTLENGISLYFYKDGDDDLYIDEVKSLIEELKTEYEICNSSDFDSAREEIFKKYNFEYDEFEDYDEE
ncbi:hypothetical protein [uncultured Fusobacterium sp.]|uniref:hypothetical protein n=1 Tax=uncultured Fusobacterium sp. TaxID=159267 RepID=UPI0025F5192C|nr:hypothetical protein [uncultured Fusobacterium sp.]